MIILSSPKPGASSLKINFQTQDFDTQYLLKLLCNFHTCASTSRSCLSCYLATGSPSLIRILLTLINFKFLHKVNGEFHYKLMASLHLLIRLYLKLHMYIEIVIQCMCALQKNTLVYQVYQSIVAKILLLKKNDYCCIMLVRKLTLK